MKKTSRAEQEEYFEPYLRNNSHAHGLYRDARFRRGFRYARYWKRNQGYWLVLYERRD
jgi:hypothetical protein